MNIRSVDISLCRIGGVYESSEASQNSNHSFVEAKGLMKVLVKSLYERRMNRTTTIVVYP